MVKVDGGFHSQKGAIWIRGYDKPRLMGVASHRSFPGDGKLMASQRWVPGLGGGFSILYHGNLRVPPQMPPSPPWNQGLIKGHEWFIIHHYPLVRPAHFPEGKCWHGGVAGLRHLDSHDYRNTLLKGLITWICFGDVPERWCQRSAFATPSHQVIRSSRVLVKGGGLPILLYKWIQVS